MGSSSQLPDLVDYDEYDAKVFRNSSSYSTVQEFPPQGSGFRRIRSAMDVPCLAKSMSRDDIMLRRKSSPPRGVCSFEDFETNSSSLNASQVSEFEEFLLGVAYCRYFRKATRISRKSKWTLTSLKIQYNTIRT